jgi:hypothetical protein
VRRFTAPATIPKSKPECTLQLMQYQLSHLWSKLPVAIEIIEQMIKVAGKKMADLEFADHNKSLTE